MNFHDAAHEVGRRAKNAAPTIARWAIGVASYTIGFGVILGGAGAGLAAAVGKPLVGTAFLFGAAAGAICGVAHMIGKDVGAKVSGAVGLGTVGLVGGILMHKAPEITILCGAIGALCGFWAASDVVKEESQKRKQSIAALRRRSRRKHSVPRYQRQPMRKNYPDMRL